MGVILIIIYIYIYNNFIWVGVGYSFSMLQMFVLLQRWHFAFRRMPTMLIYAKIAAEYGISEDRVRKIIRSP